MASPRGGARRPARSLSRQGGVQVEGLRELGQKLAKLARVTRGRALDSALVAGSEPIRAEWARLARRSDTTQGTSGKGHAADHISTVLVESGAHREAHTGPEADFWYLVFDEFGTPHQAANAPGRRAADAKLDESVRAFRDELRGRVEAVARGRV